MKYRILLLAIILVAGAIGIFLVERGVNYEFSDEDSRLIYEDILSKEKELKNENLIDVAKFELMLRIGRLWGDLAAKDEEREDVFLMEAIDAYKRSAKFENVKNTHFWNIGVTYRDLGEYEKAEEYYILAAERDPRPGVFIALLELYIHDLKIPEGEVIATYESFIANVKGNRDIVVKYASYLESIGRYQDAFDGYTEVLKVEPENESIKQAILELEKLLREQGE
jgi:tetratricopeptide (TPR) repeat protein